MCFTPVNVQRSFSVPFGPWLVPILGILLCILLLIGTTGGAAIRFGVWMGVGHIIYFSYGFWKSKRDLGRRNSIHNSTIGLNEELTSDNTLSNAPNDVPLAEMKPSLKDEP